MAENFGDDIAGDLGKAMKDALGAAKNAVVNLSGEAKDMLAASKELAGAGGTPAREHLAEHADLTR